MTFRRVWILALSLAALPAGLAAAQDNGKAQKVEKIQADNYDRVYERYLETARTTPTTAQNAWMTNLFADHRARAVNDLVTVHVIENVVAAGSADSSLDKDSSADASTGRIFGIDPKFADWFDPTALARFSASTGFKGGGATTRSGALSAVMTARVTEVLPNGDLVLEGIREIDINGDRQMIVLTGVVRTADIGPGNVVPSTAVGQMRIRYFGRGLIKDNLTPGWLIRILNKIF
jgi:flagellar L-ring protein precursor FlgH